MDLESATEEFVPAILGLSGDESSVTKALSLEEPVVKAIDERLCGVDVIDII